MNPEDDDLPVLTQVLRTGSGGLPASDDVATPRGPAGSSINLRFDDLDNTDDTLAWPRALVIGSDPEVHEDDAMSSQAHATVADPRRIDLLHNDAFLRTSPTGTPLTDGLDEPPLVVEGGGDDMTISRDIPLVFRDRTSIAARDLEATLASRVRDSVLQELSARIDTELDARIAQTLHAGLETALAQLQASLRIDLAEALRDVVGHAVDEAVMRLRDTAPFDDRR